MHTEKLLKKHCSNNDAVVTLPYYIHILHAYFLHHDQPRGPVVRVSDY